MHGNYFHGKSPKLKIQHFPLEEKNDFETMLSFYKEMHQQNPNMFPGASIRHHIQPIGDIIKDKKAETILDYGCGQGKQYTEWKVHEQRVGRDLRD